MQYNVYDLNNEKVWTISEQRWQKNCNDSQLLLRYLVLPLKEDEHTLWLALDDEKNLNACEIFSFLTHKHIEPILISSDELKYFLNELSPNRMNDQINEPQIALYNQKNSDEIIDYQDPIIQLLDNIFKYSLQKEVSDIHIEPQKDLLVIRLRIDGVLQRYQTISQNMASRIISRIKLLAKLDISETRLPQDGQFYFQTQLNERLDFRVSTLPTYYGEKLVLRLQKNNPTNLDFVTLGFTQSQRKILINALNKPQGLILVTGPTGSGKSITLYSALNYLNQTDKHILTAEDPIEIVIEGIIQTQVNRSIGIDFSQLLRTFLRQDPDIIMLGEIRDQESAEIALRAAQTGHLVLSTLHTNDAPSAIERLLQLGIKEYEIKHSLQLVIAQRLIRKLCSNCNGTGCENCFEGYKGRIGVFQCLSKNAKTFDKETAYLDFKTLYDSAKQKVAQNQTNLTEVMRVIGNESI
ncbi:MULTISPECIES: GspE/PulE family protein [Pasteurellaceae]|uniref:GspE/PulE family protein n=1 Tax=Pasteurella atlantica TaxID=2827233 RepID=A0AAW8CHJ2_9PAST|nr:GspE/PulE family protein [Pasteurella atlantica]MBR0574519.1 type II/IV secretion system protein [Pasteurella atlantica]MDP8040386.1 GspE/PulE family protein [Pasteurella atlantica]MDP8042564.1 GspE/PulE family protein [Pasteurella atlantica]MDP8044656.1 GspE/PulE family protein [Pasteurella atlantica]MDP8046715.1 GspE/PulE family protein [Pasteurella atlantica]